MNQSYETGEQESEFGAKQPHELLLMLGGVLAILLSAAVYGIQWVTPPGISTGEMPDVVTTVIINLVLGGALIVAATISKKSLMNGALVAGVIGVILIYYGGQPGTIGGIVGVLGAILAGLKPYLPWSKRE